MNCSYASENPLLSAWARECIVVPMKETAMERRTASRIDYWREQVAQQERSGVTVKQYCEKHGITAQSFYVWPTRLRPEPTLRFALVDTPPPAPDFARDA